MIIGLEAQVLRERHARKPVQRTLECPGDRAAGENEGKRGIQADVHAADNRVGLGFDEVRERDVDAIRRRAVDDPRGTAEPAVGLG